MDARKLLIDGKWIDAQGGRRFQVTNPATGEPFAEAAEASSEDVDRAAAVAHEAFEKGPWPRMAARERARILYRIADLIRHQRTALAELESRSSGKTITDALDDVDGAAACFEYYAGAATRVVGETIPVATPGLDFTLREPVGACALIVPWNFPIAIAAWKLAPALAAGCTAVLKPASYSPLTALELGAICLDAGVPPGVANVLTGPGAKVGNALAEHPLIAKIAFTGETTTGQEILRAAAGTMKRVSLELGGKSPLIVFEDADLAKAAEKAPYSVFGNAGQDCCARSRGFVQRRVYEEFVERFVAKTRALKIGDPLDPTSEIGPLVSQRQVDRVLGYVEAGRRDGASLLCGGTRPADFALARGAYLEPAVFARAHTAMRITREEIFGPVATFIPFDSEEELVGMVNDSPYGLSGSLWTRDVGRAIRIAKRVRTGVLSVNANSSVHVEAPFGGFKMSGMGRDLGMAALANYTELKNVFISME